LREYTYRVHLNGLNRVNPGIFFFDFFVAVPVKVFERMGNQSITEKLVSTLRPGDRVMCARVSGFGVRCTPKRGKIVFFARVGNRVCTVGHYPKSRVKDAKEAARQKLQELRRATTGKASAQKEPVAAISMGSNEWRALLKEVIVRTGPVGPIAPPTTPESKPTNTVGQLIEQLSERFFAKKNPKTKRKYTYSLNKHVVKRWANTPVSELTERVLEDWYQEGQRNDAWKALKGILKLAARDKLIERVPNPVIKVPASQKGESLNLKDVPRLIRFFEDNLKSGKSSMPWADFALLYIMNTGERSEATRTLMPSEVHWKSGAVRKTRKGNVTLTIPVSRYVLKLLRRIRPGKDTGYFFRHRFREGQFISEKSLRLYFQKVCREQKIMLPSGKLPVVHSLRHTFATLLKKKGVPDTEIQILMGHADIATTYRYFHGSESDARKHLDSITVTRANLDDINRNVA